MATVWKSEFSAFIVNWYFQQIWLIQDSLKFYTVDWRLVLPSHKCRVLSHLFVNISLPLAPEDMLLFNNIRKGALII